jgi:hypothetical protein
MKILKKGLHNDEWVDNQLFVKEFGIADCGLRIADCGFGIADCGLWIADCGLWIVDCGLRIAEFIDNQHIPQSEIPNPQSLVSINFLTNLLDWSAIYLAKSQNAIPKHLLPLRFFRAIAPF